MCCYLFPERVGDGRICMVNRMKRKNTQERIHNAEHPRK